MFYAFIAGFFSALGFAWRLREIIRERRAARAGELPATVTLMRRRG